MGYVQTLALIMGMSFVVGCLIGSMLVPSVTAQVGYPLSVFFQSPERGSPHDWVAEENIFVYDDRVVFYVDDPYWSKFLDTNSMDPVIDEDSNAIQIRPDSPSDIHVGDVISYRAEQGVIIHRVVEVGADAKGWYAVTRGDNNAHADAQKVRFDAVERILVAVIY